MYQSSAAEGRVSICPSDDRVEDALSRFSEIWASALVSHAKSLIIRSAFIAIVENVNADPVPSFVRATYSG